MMGQVRVDCFMLSLDGYGAGAEQSLAAPMGLGGGGLSGWAFGTATFRKMFGQEGGTQGVDDGFARASLMGLGAWVMGRNMFTHSRGSWPDDGWRGWWGEEPPYHCPVYVLTHHKRPDLQVGETTFHFVDTSITEAVALARTAAGGRDIRIGGGTATLRAALAARLVDRLHIALAPVLLGRGEALWPGLDLPALGYRLDRVVQGEGAQHLVFGRGTEAPGTAARGG